MAKSSGDSIMWQDYIARRPMEIETYLGSPIKLAQDSRIAVPRIETLYAILHNLNILNRNKPKPGDPAAMLPPTSPMTSPLPRMPSQNGQRPPMMNGMPNGNGMPRGPRPRNSSNLSQGGMRRGPPSINGGPPNGYGRLPPSMGMNMVNGGGSRQPSRRGSLEENSLEEFSHLVLYDDIPEGSEPSIAGDGPENSLRERELQLRQRELALREQEMRMRRGPPHGPPGPRGPPQRGPHPMRRSQQVFDDDDDDDDDYFDPSMNTGAPMIDPDNFDMMSVTSRRNRKNPGPSAAQIRQNPDTMPPPSRGSRFRPNFGRNRTSGVSHAPMTTDNILDDPLLSCSSNRYGTVDRGTMNAGSRANSLTASRLDGLAYGPGPGGPPGMNGAYPRRSSQSPGNPYTPSMRGGNGRPSPPNGFAPGPGVNGRPSPPDGVRQPVPRYPPGQGNSVAPQQVEQHIGVSAIHPPKPRNVRSLTGSASASAGSGEFDSEPSAHSSQNSLQQQRPTIGVR